MFFFQAAQARRHNSMTAQVAENALRFLAIHYRKPADVVAQHLGGGFGERFVWIRNDDMRGSSFEDSQGSGGILIQGAQDVSTGDDSGELSLAVHH